MVYKTGMLAVVLLFCMIIARGQDLQKQCEHFDSIVTRHNEYPELDEKQVFFYTATGKIRQINYYSNRDNRGWVMTNKREYYQDSAGRDTLMLIYHHDNDAWVFSASHRSSYDEQGKLVSEEHVNYLKDGNSHSRYDYSYDKVGRKTVQTTYIQKEGEWVLWEIKRYTYDTQGRLTAINGEDHAIKERVNQRKTRLRYNRQGHLVARTDSVNTGDGFREVWKRKYTYRNSSLKKEKEELTTVDHDQVHQTEKKRVYDKDGDLIRELRYNKKGEGHRSLSSYSYDKTISRDSVCGLSFLSETTDFLRFQHKILKESCRSENSDYAYETIYYYSPNSQLH